IHTTGSMSIFAGANNPRTDVGQGLQAFSFGAPIVTDTSGGVSIGPELTGNIGGALVLTVPAAFPLAGAGIGTAIALSAATASTAAITFVPILSTSLLIAGGATVGVL